MNTQRTAAPRHQTRTVPVDPRGPGRKRPTLRELHAAPERTPHPLLSLLLCAVVLSGGALAGHAWLVETCPTAPSADLQQVCTAILN